MRFYYKLKYILLRTLNIRLNNEAQHRFWGYKNSTPYMKRENYCPTYFNHYKLWNELVKNINFKGLSGYDYGCGGGIFSKLLADKGADITGVDYSKNRDYKYNVVFKDITKFVSEKKVDFINCCRVLTHLEYSKQDLVLQKIRQNLKDKGYLILLESERGVTMNGHFRDWRNCLIFHGFKIQMFLSDGVMHCILAEK